MVPTNVRMFSVSMSINIVYVANRWDENKMHLGAFINKATCLQFYSLIFSHCLNTVRVRVVMDRNTGSKVGNFTEIHIHIHTLMAIWNSPSIYLYGHGFWTVGGNWRTQRKPMWMLGEKAKHVCFILSMQVKKKAVSSSCLLSVKFEDSWTIKQVMQAVYEETC